MAEKTNNKAKNGRPSKYKLEYCEEIIKFFNVEPYEDREIPHYNDEGNIVWTDYKRFGVKLPTLVQFAKNIGVCYSTVYNWQNEKHTSFHKEFLEAYTRAKEMQKDFLIQAGCLGVYNARFAIFAAINITDMKNQITSEITGSTDRPLHIILFDQRDK